MKKTLIALAALAATGAFAQSSVTLSGGINVGFGRTVDYTKTTTGQGVTGISSNQVAANNVTFTAVEDLGSGLKATAGINVRFSPATGENISNGAGATNTTDAFAQNVSLAVSHATLGEVKAGRFTGLLGAALLALDPFATDVAVVGIDSTNLVPTRYNSMLSYTSPSFAGFKAGIQYADKGANGGLTKKNGLEAAVMYANGPISAVLGTTKITSSAVKAIGTSDSTLTGTANGSTVAKVAPDGTDTTTFAASYDFGFVKPMFAYASNKDQNLKETAFGLTAPMGAFLIKAAYKITNDDTAKNIKGNALGVTYALSKRTSLIADTYDNNAKVGTTATARSYYLGARHTF